MKINFDKIFLGILWLMTATLATTFWMNTKYGFNIFSSEHWAYLSQLQSQRTNIKSGFYISLVFALIVSVVVLYFLIRPRFRKIPMPVASDTKSNDVIEQPTTSIKQADKQRTTQPEQDKDKTINTTNIPQNVFGLSRPISPMSGTVVKDMTQYKPAPMVNPGQNAEQREIETTKKIDEIFGKAGYTVKKCSNIAGITHTAFAIGYNQSVWVGLTEKTAEQGQSVIDTLVTFFSDTLGETAEEINVHVCIVNPAKDSVSESDTLHLFSTIDELNNFMTENPNTEPEDFEPEIFEAFSSYIDTVTNYIGKH